MPVALVVAVCEGPCVYSGLNPCRPFCNEFPTQDTRRIRVTLQVSPMG
jgi:hypothetical protein